MMIEGDPVISFRVEMDGFEATAVESHSEQKVDVTSVY